MIDKKCICDECYVEVKRLNYLKVTGMIILLLVMFALIIGNAATYITSHNDLNYWEKTTLFFDLVMTVIVLGCIGTLDNNKFDITKKYPIKQFDKSV